ncbi:MAG: glutamate racemase [Deltaproteobacteria bacterium]|nr:glutamate racemase [Deltaproteobacteria bacterium]
MTHIAVFDSGVGGLTVLRAIHRRLPGVSTAYLGDTARVPYGTRSAETVIRYARNAARFLVDRERPELFVVACNTASAVALPTLEAELDVRVIGVIEPTAAFAAAVTRVRRVGVIGTQGTIRAEAYQRALHSYATDIEVIAKPCPLFVPLAEEGWTHDEISEAIAERYLAPIRAAGVDVLVLGCTHYPLLKEVIGHVMGPRVTLADAGEVTAERISEMLGPEGTERISTGVRRYYVTDLPGGFLKVAERFLEEPIEKLEEVDLV